MSPSDALETHGTAGAGVYVFCLVRAQAAPAAVGHGLTEASPLRVLVHQEVAAVCCEVPLQDWTGEVGEAHLSSLEWLGPRAMRHEEVIEQMMRASPVLPLRFGCLFSSAERLAGLLQREGARIAAFLDKAAREEEWSLQGSLDVRACEESLFAADPRAATLPASRGARYLMEQKLRRDAALAARAWVHEAEAEVARALEGWVLARRSLRPTPRAAEENALEGIFHWAILIPRGGEEELARRLEPLAERFAARGLRLAAQGPWPAYSFAPHFGDKAGEVSEEQAHG